jgi:pimeloyl-ACP methyl ester carboxylesterase
MALFISQTEAGPLAPCYAARWMAARGFAHPVVIGHSNGDMLAVQHVADHPETSALVLLSAHTGGTGLRRSGPHPCRVSRPGLSGNRSCRQKRDQ